ncbi:HesA/MoeB/ThiF family protein [Litoribaculum gwangyangense]|uniref:Molybdopterin-synthase adenylyltransferase MoeB n=1 Tax=Litoribaculum gwangyangense TaxID=1130722 RepID=A0ABP9CKA4_9FLAO
MDRYNRHIILSEIGEEGQNKLSKAKVLVVGAGGLGCPVLQYLTAAGIGTIGIIDFDVVEKSNLQRQILFGKSSLGKNKALVAKQHLEDLNDDISIVAYSEKLTYQNALSLFELYDIVVDGSDNFETRYLVNDACIITKKPVVYGAIYKFEGQVSVFNYENGPSYRCLFPETPKDTVPNCSEIGVFGVLPGIIGSMQANEVLKMVIGIGDVLSGKLLLYNALSTKSTILKIHKLEPIFDLVLKEKDNFHRKQLNNDCEIQAIEVSIKDMSLSENIQFIDVREAHEQPKIDDFSITQIPLNDLKKQLENIHPEKQKLIFCQSGIRSKKAVSILNALNVTNCYSVKESASEIIKYLGELKKIST